LRLGGERRALKRRGIDNVADLDHAHGRPDFHQREDAEGAAAGIDHGAENPLLVLLALCNVCVELRLIGKRARRKIGPDGIMAAHRHPQRRAIPAGVETLDGAVADGSTWKTPGNGEEHFGDTDISGVMARSANVRRRRIHAEGLRRDAVRA
jgi:hypothetical protein